MGKRIIRFVIDEQEMQFDFGSYALMMYYAKQINDTNAKLLFDATLSEYHYRVSYDLSVGDLTWDDDISHFDITELQQAAAFIANQLISALNNEPQDLLIKYGGRDNFYDLFYIDKGFLENIAIDVDEFYDSDPEQIVFTMNRFSAFLQYAISVNRSYEVIVE